MTGRTTEEERRGKEIRWVVDHADRVSRVSLGSLPLALRSSRGSVVRTEL